MKTVRWCAVVCAVAFGVRAGGAEKENKLPDAVVAAFEKAESLELYSLDGERSAKDGWHGAKVLGQTTVKGKGVREVGALIKKGVAEGDGGAKCFIPRHGVRIAHDKKTYDLVICFECSWVYVFVDGSDQPTVLSTSGSPQKALNKLLTDAKVPLDKPEK